MKRMAILATTSILLDDECKRPGVMVSRCLAAFDGAAKWKPDLIVFPEEIDYAGLDSEGMADAGEQVPGGPTQEQFALRARKHNVNVVVGLRESDGDTLYNAGVVIDRNGDYVGKYRKTHLAPGESDEVLAADDYPVFELDFGKVGVMICMDVHYPEPWRILALQGADVIAHPTMWRDYTGDLCESLVNARAIDNQVYVVTSHYVTQPFLTGGAQGHARIVDPFGRTRASTSHLPGVAVAEVDLDQAYEFWATGDLKKKYPTLKECFLADRRPETYGILTRPDSENSWKIEDPTLHARE
jgi:predicted amidohydrolase